jgi:rhodanese-related sulfurtransferase
MNFESLQAFALQSPMLSLALVGLTVAIIYTEISRFFTGYKTVNSAGLTALINREDAQVFDVSAIGDFDKGHIAGAKNIVLSQISAENKQLAKVKEQPIVLVCRTGMQSAEAAKKLVKAGFAKVFWLDGGVAAWQQADLPLVKGKN